MITVIVSGSSDSGDSISDNEISVKKDDQGVAANSGVDSDGYGEDDVAQENTNDGDKYDEESVILDETYGI